MQTDATLLANNTQHRWAQHVASVCMESQQYWHLLALVAYSLKPVKLLGPCKRTQHCDLLRRLYGHQKYFTFPTLECLHFHTENILTYAQNGFEIKVTKLFLNQHFVCATILISYNTIQYFINPFLLGFSGLIINLTSCHFLKPGLTRPFLMLEFTLMDIRSSGLIRLRTKAKSKGGGVCAYVKTTLKAKVVKETNPILRL